MEKKEKVSAFTCYKSRVLISLSFSLSLKSFKVEDSENPVIVFIATAHLSEVESEELRIKETYEKCC